MRRWLMLLLMSMTLLWVHAAKAATPASWKETGFSINADGMPLREVLDAFGQAYGVRISYSMKETSPLRGRLKAENGTDFLNRLTATHNFRWFVYNDTLYVVPSSDNTSMRLQVGEDAVQDAKTALVGLGLYDARFGWGELPDEGVVVVSGPREYVTLARDILLPEGKRAEEVQKQTLKGKQIMVFRLKYASATDRVINTRGQKETIPGIKTILNGLLSSGGGASLDKVTGNYNSGQFEVSSEKRSRQGKNGKGSAEEVGGNTASKRLQHDAEEGSSDNGKGNKNATREERPHIDADPTMTRAANAKCTKP
jgi:type III secretion protein C